MCDYNANIVSLSIVISLVSMKSDLYTFLFVGILITKTKKKKLYREYKIKNTRVTRNIREIKISVRRNNVCTRDENMYPIGNIVQLEFTFSRVETVYRQTSSTMNPVRIMNVIQSGFLMFCFGSE